MLSVWRQVCSILHIEPYLPESVIYVLYMYLHVRVHACTPYMGTSIELLANSLSLSLSLSPSHSQTPTPQLVTDGNSNLTSAGGTAAASDGLAADKDKAIETAIGESISDFNPSQFASMLEETISKMDKQLE